MAASGLADMQELPDPNTGFGNLTIDNWRYPFLLFFFITLKPRVE